MQLCSKVHLSLLKRDHQKNLLYTIHDQFPNEHLNKHYAFCSDNVKIQHIGYNEQIYVWRIRVQNFLKGKAHLYTWMNHCCFGLLLSANEKFTPDRLRNEPKYLILDIKNSWVYTWKDQCMWNSPMKLQNYRSSVSEMSSFPNKSERWTAVIFWGL